MQGVPVQNLEWGFWGGGGFPVYQCGGAACVLAFEGQGCSVYVAVIHSLEYSAFPYQHLYSLSAHL